MYQYSLRQRTNVSLYALYALKLTEVSLPEIPWKLPADHRCLVVFDLHQDVAWLDRVLEAEAGDFDHLILGGDYFDSYQPIRTATVMETCMRLNALLEEMGDRLTVLFGNHDVPYYVASRMQDPGFFYHPFSDLKNYSTQSAREIAHALDSKFWQRARCFVRAHGFLLSHAGAAGKFWAGAESEDAALDTLEQRCEDALAAANHKRHSIFAPGCVRGGEGIGGITWQDWNMEFSDEEIPLPQIVGHTRSASGARQKGRSWCLDGEQTCYGLLDADGLEVKIA